jgi:protein-tyrosine phosphatase
VAPEAPERRRLDWPDCQNTRDLGGLQRRGGVTRSGVLIRSDDVSVLTTAGREAMRAYGVTTVIDLRSTSERSGTFDARFPRPVVNMVKAQGVTYLHRELVDDASLKKLGEASNMFERYLVMLNTRQSAFREIFTAIAQAEGGLVFHCFAGKDRTGLVAAMVLALADVPPDEIAADFGETDRQLADAYEKWISDAPADKRDEMRDELRCPPERILGVLDYLETNWGGAASYLEASGMAPDAIDRLSTKLE